MAFKNFEIDFEAIEGISAVEGKYFEFLKNYIEEYLQPNKQISK